MSESLERKVILPEKEIFLRWKDLPLSFLAFGAFLSLVYYFGVSYGRNQPIYRPPLVEAISAKLPTTRRPPLSLGTGWYISVASSKSLAEMLEVSEELADLGYDSKTERVREGEVVRYRVILGPEESKMEAAGISLKLKGNRKLSKFSDRIAIFQKE